MIEKPSVDEAPSNLAVAARYVFSPEIFDRLEERTRYRERAATKAARAFANQSVVEHCQDRSRDIANMDW